MAVRGLDTLTRIDMLAIQAYPATGLLKASDLCDFQTARSTLALPRENGKFSVVDASRYTARGSIFQQVSRIFEVLFALPNQRMYVDAHANHLLRQVDTALMRAPRADEILCRSMDYTTLADRLEVILNAYDAVTVLENSTIGTIARCVRTLFILLGLVNPSDTEAKVRALEGEVSIAKEIKAEAEPKVFHAASAPSIA